MKILVTGGCGFIGKHLVNALFSAGHVVDVIDDMSVGKNIPPGLRCFVKGKVEDWSSFEQLDRWDHDVIYHLAAKSRIQPTFKDPDEAFSSNVVGTHTVCRYAKHTRAHLIYAGSSSVHSGHTQSPYSGFKFVGEEICKTYRDSFGVKVSLCRFYNVYGPGEVKEGEMAALIGKWRGLIQKGQPLPIVGDGRQKRDFTHVYDITEGLVRLMYYTKEYKGVWELGTGESYTIDQVYAMFKLRFGNECTCIHVDDQKGNYRNSKRDHDHALKYLDWEPKDRLRTYIMSLE